MCTYRDSRVCVVELTRGGRRSTSGVFPCHSPSYSLETGSLPEPSACSIQLGWLAGKPPEIPCVCFLTQGLQMDTTCPAFMWMLGIQTKSFRVCSKCFIHQTISCPILWNSNRLEIVTHCSRRSCPTVWVSRVTIKTKSSCKLARTV